MSLLLSRASLVGAWRMGAGQLAQLQRGVGGVRTFADDSHDDFKPKIKTASPAPADVNELFKQDIANNSVFVYMKGNPSSPRCGFSNMVCKIFEAYGVKFGSRNVLDDDDVREGIKTFSNWPTIPQVYINGEFVGGADILHGMHQTGELEKVVEPIVRQQRAGAQAAK